MTFNNITQNKIINLTELISQMKYEDQKSASNFKRMRNVYWITMPLYLILIVKQIIQSNALSEIVINIFIAFSLLLFAIIYTKVYKSYGHIDYSQPTLELLKKAELRFRPINIKKLLRNALAFLLIEALLVFASNSTTNFLKGQIYMGSGLILSFLIGFIVWKVKYQRIHANIVTLIKEIEQVY